MAFMLGHVSMALLPISKSFSSRVNFSPIVWSIWSPRVILSTIYTYPSKSGIVWQTFYKWTIILLEFPSKINPRKLQNYKSRTGVIRFFCPLKEISLTINVFGIFPLPGVNKILFTSVPIPRPSWICWRVWELYLGYQSTTRAGPCRSWALAQEKLEFQHTLPTWTSTREFLSKFQVCQLTNARLQFVYQKLEARNQLLGGPDRQKTLICLEGKSMTPCLISYLILD